MRRTKIVATLGPASNSFGRIRRLLRSGVDVARLNFSHGTREEHAEVVRRVREAAEREGRTVAVLAELGGPKIRIGEIPDPGVTVRRGEEVRLRPGAVGMTGDALPISHPGLAGEVPEGARILVDDGRIELVVVSRRGEEIRARVRSGGLITSRRGVNLPGVRLSMPSLTEKDRADLAVALVAGVDYVGLSFVRTAADVTALREAIEAAGSPARIVAKIETAEAVENRTAILEAADAVMVARGDLGVEIGSERVPVVQKETILAGVAANRPVITATEMLESMIRNPRPTRAETSDVANAVFDGSDAVMLSGETSIGEHPAAAVGMMRRIAVRAERHLARYGAAALLHREPERTFGDAIGCAARDLAGTLGARAIVAFTRSGATALRISRWRPVVPVVAFTPDEGVARRLAPVWGVLPRLFPAVRSVDDMLGRLDPRLCEAGLARPGDVVVVVAGAPVGEAGRTNFLTLHRLAGPEAKE